MERGDAEALEEGGRPPDAAAEPAERPLTAVGDEDGAERDAQDERATSTERRLDRTTRNGRPGHSRMASLPEGSRLDDGAPVRLRYDREAVP